MSTTREVLDLWMDGSFAGQLMRAETDEVEFRYDDSYRFKRASAPLSTSMPKSSDAFGPAQVMPWLANLVPDAVEVRERWAAKFDESRSDPFTLLRHMGQDAQGAVQIVAEGADPSQQGSLTAMTDRSIAERIQGIVVDPDHWVDDSDRDASRFSLGGNQGKFALARIEGEWFEPNGRAASTHIVKPGMVTVSGQTNTEVQAIEFVTMRASSLLGIPTAKVAIEDFDGCLAYVTTRYDRLYMGGEVRRLHQEDFCQALSVFPARKYEEDGGPTMADMVELVANVSSSRYRNGDAQTLSALFMFNLLAAGVDAHAKNHSLLLFGDQARLAPVYDLVSAHGLWDEKRVKFQSSAAVRYGKVRRYRNITGRDLARTADVLSVPREHFTETLRQMANDLPHAFEQAVAELPAALTNDAVKAMPDRAAAFSASMCERMTAKELRESPTPLRTRRSVRRPRPDWLSGYWQGDSWVLGHLRTRPGPR